MITYNLGGYKTSQRHHKSTSEQLVFSPGVQEVLPFVHE
jgi:hypothetical protein